MQARKPKKPVAKKKKKVLYKSFADIEGLMQRGWIIKKPEERINFYLSNGLGPSQMLKLELLVAKMENPSGNSADWYDVAFKRLQKNDVDF